MNTNKEIFDYLINLPNSILLGSRAFGVETESSDYDIAVLRSDIKDIDILPKKELNPENYFSCLPLGNVGLVKYMATEDFPYHLDILIYDDLNHIKDIKHVVEQMKQIPKWVLKNKSFRVDIFMQGLENRGWIWKDKPIHMSEKRTVDIGDELPY
jgi:predicted nucleotidyltransferase